MCGARISEMFDLVCGTSTGGIIALATCVVKKPVEDMIKVYSENAGECLQTQQHRNSQYC
jgi:patatin-like phospholipase/acyl hydrolase